jgi:hypothetical protein
MPRTTNRISNLKSAASSLEGFKELFEALDKAGNVGGVLSLGNTTLQSAHQLVKAVDISVDACWGDIESIVGSGGGFTLRNATGERAEERLDFSEHGDSELRVFLEAATGLLAFGDAVCERADEGFDFGEHRGCEFGVLSNVAGLLAFRDATGKTAKERFDFTEHGLDIEKTASRKLFTLGNSASETTKERLDLAEHGLDIEKAIRIHFALSDASSETLKQRLDLI